MQTPVVSPLSRTPIWVLRVLLGALFVGLVCAFVFTGHDEPVEPAQVAPPAVANPLVLPGEAAHAAVDSDGDMEALLHTARELYINGEYEAAAEVVEPATRVASTANRAWRILGAAACFEKDGHVASRARQHLDEAGRKFVSYVCARNDVSI